MRNQIIEMLNRADERKLKIVFQFVKALFGE